VVDIATLTGAVAAMFGFTTTGVLSNNDAFFGALLKAAYQGGEQVWRLPNFPEYQEMINSEVADLSNTSDGCGTIAAGLFVGAFAEELPWLHLDIAGTAWVDKPQWEYQTKGATGAGVSSLYYLCKQYTLDNREG
jgi:leucyl aminopeptidase